VQGLVDGAVSFEEPETAHKPNKRGQVSTRVRKVRKPEKTTVGTWVVTTRVNRPYRAQQEDDPHGLQTHGPKWTSKQDDPHGLLTQRPEMAHTQGSQPLHVHDDNPPRVTMNEPGAHVGHPARHQSKTRNGARVGHPHMDHNGQQFRFYIWRTAMFIISIFILMNGRGDPQHPTHRLQSCLEAETVNVIHTTSLPTPTRQWQKSKPDLRGEVPTEVTVAQDVPTALQATSNNRTQTWNSQQPHTPQMGIWPIRALRHKTPVPNLWAAQIPQGLQLVRNITPMLEKAHHLLNTDNPLGRIVRSRVVDLRDKLGWTASPLATPAKASPHLWRQHWMGRVMHLLWESNSTIADPSAQFSRPANRARDIPISQALPADIFLHLRPQLRAHIIYWVGDMAN
jgi:hypothetical protein